MRIEVVQKNARVYLLSWNNEECEMQPAYSWSVNDFNRGDMSVIKRIAKLHGLCKATPSWPTHDLGIPLHAWGDTIIASDLADSISE